MKENQVFNEERIQNQGKVKNSNAALIIIIFLIIIILIAGYFIIYNKDQNTSKNTTTTTTAPINTEISVSKVESLLKDYIPYYQIDGTVPNLYVDRKVTFTDINENAILNITINIYNTYYSRNDACISDVNEEEVRETYGEDYFVITNADSCILISDYQQIIKEVFNQDNFNIPNGFDISGGSANVYQDKIYLYQGRGSYGVERFTLDYQYEVVNDELYIRELIALVDWSFEDTIKLYTNESTEPFATLKEIEVTNINEMILTNYKDLLKSYTHIFKKNALGNYYWVSTEPFSS